MTKVFFNRIFKINLSLGSSFIYAFVLAMSLGFIEINSVSKDTHATNLKENSSISAKKDNSGLPESPLQKNENEKRESLDEFEDFYALNETFHWNSRILSDYFEDNNTFEYYSFYIWLEPKPPLYILHHSWKTHFSLV